MKPNTADTAIVVDSIACIPAQLVADFNIKIIPVNILFGGTLYRDMVDLTSAQAYEFIRKDPGTWKSSAASPEEYVELFRELGRHVKNILVITISARLSGFYNSAMVARRMALMELPSVEIEILDSRTVAAAEGLIALAAARAAGEGGAFREVVAAADQVRERVSFLGLLETIEYVYRTGRIPKLASRIGSMLALKPVLTGGNGSIRLAGTVRTRQAGIERMLSIMRKRTGQQPLHVAVMHADASQEAEALRYRIAQEFDCTELFVTDFSPIMAYATGRGTLALAFYPAV
ncbi:MAG: DegV family protein [Dehalococcoidaceae bacterium]|nr:DegV family protein [Dehalococcoidaceae bacterium]